MNFKKTLLATLTTFMVGGVVLSANQNTSQFEPQAANPETKRIWAIARETWWFNDGAAFVVETKVGSTYQWLSMQQDTNNVNTGGGTYSGNNSIAYYVDIPTNIEQVQFGRGVNFNNINTTGFINYSSGMNYVFSGSVTVDNSFNFSTTVVVSNFNNSYNDAVEVCTFAGASNAIDAYNNLKTFEQNQYDVLDVGAGVTGLQRLQYLKDFYSISTALN